MIESSCNTQRAGRRAQFVAALRGAIATTAIDDKRRVGRSGERA